MENHFFPQENLQKLSKTKMDPEVVKSMQSYAEKVITDIINRAGLLAKHGNKDVIGSEEIRIIVERDFDFSYGMRTVMDEPNLPTNEHTEKTAEISRQR